MDALPLRHHGRPPRLLLLTSAYFLLGEIKAACERLEVPHLLVDLATKEMTSDVFVRTIREACASFRPDVVLTVNHLGVDREGVLYQLLRQARLPLVSWFVDNPEFILPIFPAPDPDQTLIFTWDADSLDAVRGYGFRNVFWLPLGADVQRFHPGRSPESAATREDWRARVSFVGNSMLEKTMRRLSAALPTPGLVGAFAELSQSFGQSGERGVRAFLAVAKPELLPEFDALDVLRRTAYETALVWQSTLIYRLGCVARTMAHGPLIVGDPGWQQLLTGQRGYRLHKELSYYTEMPEFYPLSEVNFNCTSLQMKGAVNQRVFDVPAAGAFLLTDHRRQIERLFEPDTEVALYHSQDEIPELLDRYLADPALRARIAAAGRARVLAQHTYEHRLSAMLAAMDQCFFRSGA
jgi:spore maturation protein CgeB